MFLRYVPRFRDHADYKLTLAFFRPGECKSNQCTLVTPLAQGAACSAAYQCPGGVSCINGFCTGGEDTCQANDGNAQAIGSSTDCTSGFCRAGSCSNVPAAYLGDVCDDARDCAGSDNNANRNLLDCGSPQSNTRKCGGGGAFCVANDGSGSGSAAALCISGKQEVNRAKL